MGKIKERTAVQSCREFGYLRVTSRQERNNWGKKFACSRLNAFRRHAGNAPLGTAICFKHGVCRVPEFTNTLSHALNNLRHAVPMIILIFLERQSQQQSAPKFNLSSDYVFIIYINEKKEKKLGSKKLSKDSQRRITIVSVVSGKQLNLHAQRANKNWVNQLYTDCRYRAVIYHFIDYQTLAARTDRKKRSRSLEKQTSEPKAGRSMGIRDYHYPTGVTRKPRDNYKINEPSMNRSGDRGWMYVILGRKRANVVREKRRNNPHRRNLHSSDGHVPPPRFS